MSCLCSQCFNAEVAARADIADFDNHPLDPISLVDAQGIGREFHFRTRLLGHMVVIDAFELHEAEPSGYQFREVGTPEEDRFGQLARLVQKMRSALATQYVEEGTYGPQIKDMEVRGRIESDTSDEGNLFGRRAPVLVIDGREVSWGEFGQMLTTFEGFQFKLQIRDASDGTDD